MKGKIYSLRSKKNVKSDTDPYLVKESPRGIALCQKCHGIYHNKHWSFDEEKFKNISRSGNANFVVCPACRKIKDGYPEGVVTLRGDFLKRHREEILNLIRNEEDRAKGFNPLERIINIEQGNEKIVVTTTNEKIAQRIGREIYKAYQGEIEYKWSHDNKLVRVEWMR